MSIWQKIKNFAKERPFWTAFIVAGLITATVFTGGMILAPAAVFAWVAFSGALTAFIGGLVCTTILGNPPYNASAHNRRLGWGVLLAEFGILVGTFFCPPVGVAFFLVLLW